MRCLGGKKSLTFFHRPLPGGNTFTEPYLRFMRSSLLIVLMFCGLFAVNGQVVPPSKDDLLHPRGRAQKLEMDISGLWTGELLQNEGGIADRFEFSMQLSQNGIFLNGTAYVSFGEIWAEMKFSGYQLPSGSWRLTETEILRFNKPEELSWCMKHYELRVGYTESGMTLHGPWWGSSKFGPCVPGSVRLKIKKKSA